MQIQLISVASGVATIQRDDDAPVVMTWGELHEAQQQDGQAGYVYRWLMREYCRCEFEARNGRPWSSARREVADIVAQMQARDASDAATAAATRNEAAARENRLATTKARDTELSRVAKERATMTGDDPWYPIPSWEVPGNIRFDTLRQDAGQIVEVSYGTFGRGEAGTTDPYMHIWDRSDGSVKTYKRRQP